MAKRMLVDAAHPEETRVVVLNGQRLEEFDFETSTKKQIKGNIYLAKVTRVEPSLQAAFVEYGGNRHGFLAFGEIHPDYYRIPVADRQAALDADRAAEEAANEREEESVEAGLPVERSADAHESDDEHGEIDHDHADSMTEAMSEDRLIDDLVPDPEAASERDGHDSSAFPEDSEAPASVDIPVEEPSFSATAPEGHAFAHDDGERGAEPVSESTEPPELTPAAESTPPIEVVAETPVTIETIGGDEIEETARPRARPHRHYKIQEVIKRRQIMLVQVTKEERGNKGAALTTYISLAGRYCVLMPNTPRGGGVSRKITSMQDRRRLKDLMSDLEVPDGMGVIVRTAGSERSKAEITRDFEYLLRLWDDIRELTLKSTAPALIYEEGNLIKRSIRDLYARDIDEVLVDGREGYDTAKSFMRMLMPSHAKRVKLYNDPSVPLFHRFQVEGQLDAIHSPVVQLRSGGYIVINPTEALVAIDVNSGRSTRERNIEETALKTNLEAAEEVARQLRLRDLAGLIVVDFIDMEEHRHNSAVERRLKDAMRHDRARIQIGRISPFGLLELSRQRLRPSLLEASTQPCPHCNGTGHIRSTESTALHLLRALEEEGMRRRTAEIKVVVASAVALYVLNQKRATLQQIEGRYGCHVTVDEDETLIPPAFRLERMRAFTPAELAALPVPQAAAVPVEEEPEADDSLDEAAIEAAAEEFTGSPRRGDGEHRDPSSWIPQSEEEEDEAETPQAARPDHLGGDEQHGDGQGRRRRRRRRRGRGGDRDRTHDHGAAAMPVGEAPPPDAEGSPMVAAGGEPVESDGGRDDELGEDIQPAELRGGDGEGDGEHRRRRRGRRGGRRRRRGQGQDQQGAEQQFGNERGPRLQLELRPGEPGYSGPAEEFGEESDFVAAEEVAEADVIETIPARQEAAPRDARPGTEDTAATPPAPETPSAPSEAEGDTERTPVAYNVSPPHEVSGPAPNPRRGWWRR
ncbi:MAG TPA: ribonuclease E/G [Stellaceae bacterium]|nr:ribonuclease E/G [Stellaceae bacterium]